MEAQNTKASRSQSTVSPATKMAATSQCVSVSYEGTSRPLEESQAVLTRHLQDSHGDLMDRRS